MRFTVFKYIDTKLVVCDYNSMIDRYKMREQIDKGLNWAFLNIYKY